MKKRDIIKGIVGTGVSFGTGMIVGRFCGLFINPEETSKLARVLMYAGATALCGVASEKTVDYTNRTIDEFGDLYDELKGGSKPDLKIVGEDNKKGE